MNAERSKHLVVHFVGGIPLPDAARKGALRFAETDLPTRSPAKSRAVCHEPGTASGNLRIGGMNQTTNKGHWFRCSTGGGL
jgi:hypothetical protein